MEFLIIVCFFFNDTATTEIYTLSLHDALPILTRRKWGLEERHLLPISPPGTRHLKSLAFTRAQWEELKLAGQRVWLRSEEHTSELQSRQYLVCRLLLEKKKKYSTATYIL